MKFIQDEISATLEVKKSKFITHICPYNQFKNMMEQLKSEHPKGRHFVYAYRYLNEFDQIVENSSDDGEPKGTSGKPTLNVLSGNKLINTAVIIVRYFGGIKLGTGGLVKAYSDAVNLVLKDALILKYTKLIKKSLIISYSQLSQIEYILSSFEITIKEKLFQNDITLILEGSGEEFKNLSDKLFRDMILKDI